MLESFLQDPVSSSKGDPSQRASGVLIDDEWNSGHVDASAGCMFTVKDHSPLSKVSLWPSRISRFGANRWSPVALHAGHVLA